MTMHDKQSHMIGVHTFVHMYVRTYVYVAKP